MKTSNDYSPAVAVWPSGKTQPCNVKRALVLQPDAARHELVQRRATVVYVATAEDAEAVTTEGANYG